MTTDLVKSAEPVLARARGTAAAVAQILDVLPLETREDEAKAQELLRALARCEKELEAERKRIVEPIKREASKVDAAFRGPRTEIERVAGLLRRRVAECETKRERARLEAERKALAPQTPAAEANALALVASTPSDPSEGISYRYRWMYTVESMEALPPEYIVRSVNGAMVEALIKMFEAKGAEPSLPGLKFTREASVVVRTK